jgi:hypothetical protein
LNLDRNEPLRLAQTGTSNGGLSADDDADDDVEHWPRPPGQAPLCAERTGSLGRPRCRVATPRPLSTPMQAAEPLCVHRPSTSTSPMDEISQPSTMQVVQFLRPWCEDPRSAESTVEPIRKVPQEITRQETGAAIAARTGRS